MQQDRELTYLDGKVMGNKDTLSIKSHSICVLLKDRINFHLSRPNFSFYLLPSIDVIFTMPTAAATILHGQILSNSYYHQPSRCH